MKQQKMTAKRKEGRADSPSPRLVIRYSAIRSATWGAVGSAWSGGGVPVMSIPGERTQWSVFMVYARVDRRDSKVLRSSHSGAVHLMSSKRTSPLRTRTPSTAAPTALRAPAPTTFKTQRRLSPPITCSYHLSSLYAVCTASAAAMPACYACSYTLALTTPAPTIFATTRHGLPHHLSEHLLAPHLLFRLHLCAHCACSYHLSYLHAVSHCLIR